MQLVFPEGAQWCDFQMVDTSRLRRYCLKLKKEQTRVDLCVLTFNQRVVNMWNDQPADVITGPTEKAHLENLPRWPLEL